MSKQTSDILDAIRVAVEDFDHKGDALEQARGTEQEFGAWCSYHDATAALVRAVDGAGPSFDAHASEYCLILRVRNERGELHSLSEVVGHKTAVRRARVLVGAAAICAVRAVPAN